MKRILGIILTLFILNGPFLALGSENMASKASFKNKLKIAGQIAKSSFWLNQAVDWAQGFVAFSTIAWFQRPSVLTRRCPKSLFLVSSGLAGLFGSATLGATYYGGKIAIDEYQKQLTKTQK